MPSKSDVIRKIRSALEHEPRVNLHRYPIKVNVADGAVVLEGEVAHVGVKKIALERAAAVEGVRGIIDRLQVMPAQRRGDGAMRDSLCNLLLREPELQGCTLCADIKGRTETLHDAGGDARIEVAVHDGVIALEGRVISLSHKRMAGVLAWWTPGCRDVLNSLDVQPPEEDNDAEVSDALRLVLEMDPLVQAVQVRVDCRNYVVTLEGCVRTQEERRQVELDAWCLFGVDDVVNRIEVR